MKQYSTLRYHLLAVALGLMLMAGMFPVPVSAACGGGYQRMQVGVLPDVFLNHTTILVLTGAGGVKGNDLITIEPPMRGLPLPGGRFSSPYLVTSKTFNHYWTANLDFPGVGDCDIYARVTIPWVELAETYSACYPDNLNSCVMKNYPATAAVGPAIDDFTVKKWAMRVSANAMAESGSIGAIWLIGLDCQGDICAPPPCMMLEPQQPGEFYEPPPPECLGFDPDADGWNSTGPGIGDAYLVGRGNLYIGPRVQPAFELRAISDTNALVINHWIANDNPGAIILVTPKGDHAGVSRYYGVQFNATVGRWSVLAERDGATIQAGSAFNIYVMGNKGPGFRVSSAAGSDRIPIDDELTNNNPNALLIVTRLVDDACQLVIENKPVEDVPGPHILPDKSTSERWVCNEGYFDHPIAVDYDSNSGRWAIVSSDGTSFPSPVAFNVFVAGLAGTYRSDMWMPGDEPDYAGRFEAAWASPSGATMEMPQLDYSDPNGIVLITNNLTPYDGPTTVDPNLHPAGVQYTGSSWRVHNLDGSTMPSTTFNVAAPLHAP